MNRSERFDRRASLWALTTFALMLFVMLLIGISIVGLINSCAWVCIGTAAAAIPVVAAVFHASSESRRWAYLADLERQFSTKEHLRNL